MRMARLGFIALALLAGGCSAYDHQHGPDCVPPPCPLPIAIVLDVTAADTGGPIAGLRMAASGAVVGSATCSPGASATVCRLPGPPGAYSIRLTAPGFQEKAFGVTVAGTMPPCACASVQTREMSVVLARD